MARQLKDVNRHWFLQFTTWNQDCWEKYQQPHICRKYHSNGREQRRTKDTFNEGEIGE